MKRITETLTAALLATGLLLAGCTKKSEPAGQGAAPMDASARTVAKPTAKAERGPDSPPEGTVLPRVGIARKVSPGDATTAYYWKVVWEVDPAHPDVRRVIEQARADGMTIDAGNAGAALYREDVKAAGIEISVMGPGFSYYIQDGKLAVIVRPDDDFHRDDPTGYTISVGPAGG